MPIPPSSTGIRTSQNAFRTPLFPKTKLLEDGVVGKVNPVMFSHACSHLSPHTDETHPISRMPSMNESVVNFSKKEVSAKLTQDRDVLAAKSPWDVTKTTSPCVSFFF